jgi:hypothetical protein
LRLGHRRANENDVVGARRHTSAPTIDPRDITNAAWRAADGTFLMLPHRRFRADGREERGPTLLRDSGPRHGRILGRPATSRPLSA